MTALLRFEARVAAAALRRVVTHPSRRALWFVVGTVAAIAIAFDIVTSDVASRNFGAWTPSPLMFVLAAAGVLGLAALVGSRTPLTYGTRAADGVWWRYADVGTPAGRRATTAILAVRAAAYVASGAVPLGVLFALAAPAHAAAVFALATSVLVLAPLTVLVAASTARNATARADAAGGAAPPRTRASIAAALLARFDMTVTAPKPAAIPRGLAAARWLAVRRGGGALLPYGPFVAGITLGVIAPWIARTAGGQVVSMAVVVGGFAIVLDGALRGTTAPAMLRSPWWRSAVGTSPAAMIAWAVAGTLPFAFAASGASIGLAASMTYVPELGLIGVPVAVMAPGALRLLVLGSDLIFATSVDRRGAAAALRLAIVGAVTAATVTLALAAGARGGPVYAVAALTVLLAALLAASAWWCAWRLPHVVL